MRTSSFLLSLALLFTSTGAQADLFTQRADDSAIKMLHFPKSLAVIPSRLASPKGLKLKTDSVLNDPHALRILRKVDPARIVPATVEEDFHETVTRPALEALGKKYDVDILLLVRREILGMTDTSLKIRTRGLVYLVRQKKIVTVPANEKETPFTAENREDKIREMNEAALKKLAEETRRKILSHKFEKRQSAY